VISDYIAGGLQETEELALARTKSQKVSLWIVVRDLFIVHIVINIWPERMRTVRKLPPRICPDELRQIEVTLAMPKKTNRACLKRSLTYANGKRALSVTGYSRSLMI